MTSPENQPSGQQPKPPRSVKTLFASSVLCLEAALMVFFGLAAWGLNQHQWYAWWLFGASLVLAGVLVAACAVLQRPIGYPLGWALQFVMIAVFVLGAMVSGEGLIVSMALLPGLGFLACWWYAVTTGERLDAEKMERYRLEQEYAAGEDLPADSEEKDS
ncbi:DUF4233 domain-containing protein [Nesterenkonia alba]|uniref:DUF4233 domain-containing protein n=1 Tax=Nesterenkonia alba TaxID=515814 RepID=UPI0003B72C43|nr:DUF4233 domain-containing protein [Nesterenkonia alba]